MKKYIIIALLDGKTAMFYAVGKKKEIIKFFMDTYKGKNLVLLIIKRIKNSEYLRLKGLKGKEIQNG